MKFEFKNAPRPLNIDLHDWHDWMWQLKSAHKSLQDFDQYFLLTENERSAFDGAGQIFQVRSTPYYSSLANRKNHLDPIRRILMPTAQELGMGVQAELDPLGERKLTNQPTKRIIHRYSDRVLFLITDTCSVYCRYCTRKHFTGADQAFIKNSEYEDAIKYIRSNYGIREVILSGGDPLTVSDEKLDRVLQDLRSIDHIEIIRIGTRMPVVSPMRVTSDLVQIIKKAKPVFLMTHFNHPKEITKESAEAVEKFVDNGIPVMNQMVLLNGVNNHAAIVQALSRRLLFLRAKPYYMFQCDPSLGTDHLRTSIDDSLKIQKELWGHLSGLAMPQLSVDIPSGGGKAYYVPSFETNASEKARDFIGWDGVSAQYNNPESESILKPIDVDDYSAEWLELTSSRKNACI